MNKLKGLTRIAAATAVAAGILLGALGTPSAVQHSDAAPAQQLSFHDTGWD